MEYVRPYIEPMTFRDAAGNVIEYGNRWESLGGTPPEEAYAVADDTERFAPLHTIAAALIDYLVSTYDVELEEGHHVTVNPPYAPAVDDAARVVRLIPNATVCAPLVFVFTRFPGIFLYAGMLFHAAYPNCGCNACDETWDALAEDLEWQTFAIVGGGFAEKMSEYRRAKWYPDRGLVSSNNPEFTATCRLRSFDGSICESGESNTEGVPVEFVKRACQQLDALAARGADGRWLPWPSRPLSHS